MVEVMEMRRQNQNQQVRQVNQVWPEVIYLTPDRWGDETFALTREELRETVRSLRRLGAEWRHVSEGAAPQYYLSEVRGDYAIYERRVRGGVDRIRVWRHHGPDGVWYDWQSEEVQG
jgi:hypothetical protein